MKKFIGILLFLFLFSPLSGAIYYVDASRPNDDGDGLSEGAAWKTIAKVNGESFDPDDIIKFKRGEIWVGTRLNVPSSGTSGHPIIFDAYGEGADPIITLKDSLVGWDTGGNWSEIYTEIWDAEEQTGDSSWAGTTDADRNYRTVMLATSITDDATVIRLKFKAQAGQDAVIQDASIGLRSGTSDDFDGAPTNVQQGSSDSFTINAGTSEYTDDITINIDKTKDYLQALHVDNPFHKNRLEAGSGTHGYWKAEAADETEIIIVAGYGTTDDINNLESMEAKTPNIWYKTIAYDPRRVWLSETEYLKAETLGDVDATSRWFYDSGTSRLYIYATTNPASEYTDIEVSWDGTISNTVGGAKEYLTFQNLDIRGGEYAVNFTGSVHLIFDNCSVGLDTGSDGFHMREFGATPNTFLTIKNCTVESGHDFSYDYELSQPKNGIMLMNGCDNASIHDNTISNWGHDCIHMYVQTSGSVSNNEVYDNLLESPNQSYARGIGLVGPTGTVDYNKIYRNEFRFFSVRINFCGDHNEFYYNIVHDITDGGLDWNIHEGISLAGWAASPTATVCHDNVVYNNVFYNIHNEGIRISDEGDEPEDNIIKNNIFMLCGGDVGNGMGADRCLWYDADITVGTQTIENNCFYNAGETDVIHHKGTARTVAWVNANEAEYSNNLENLDPLMIDPANDDFRLIMASPCVDAGTDVGLTTDYRGRSIRHAPDIGAYEDPTNAVFMSAELLSFSDLWLLWNDKLKGQTWWEELGVYLKERQ